MHVLPTSLLALTIIWILAMSTIAARILRRRSRGELHTEHAYALGALAMLVLAPCTGLAVYAFSGDYSFFGGGLQILIAAVLGLAGWRARRYRADPEAMASAMSYREKSTALVLGSLIVVFGSYFVILLDQGFEASVAAFIGAVIVLVGLMIVGHIVLAILHTPLEELHDAEDERDRLISQRCGRYAYYVMAAGIWVIPVMALSNQPGVLIANAAFALLLVAELVYNAATLVLSRRGWA